MASNMDERQELFDANGRDIVFLGTLRVRALKLLGLGRLTWDERKKADDTFDAMQVEIVGRSVPSAGNPDLPGPDKAV